MKRAENKNVNKVVILTAIVGISTVIGILFIYIPFVNKHKSLRLEILEERDRNVLIGKIRELNKYLEFYDKRIPQGRGVSWVLSEVSDMAAKEQIEIRSIKPGTPEDHGLYTKLYVVMDATSTYYQLGKFISRIESSQKFLRVDSINIKRLDQDSGFDEKTAKFKSFDINANIVVSTVAWRQ